MTAPRRAGEKTAYREMTVQGFALDPLSQAPMVLLKNDDADSTFPIWLTTLESVAIAAELINRDAVAERGCGDLITCLFEQMQVKVQSISFDALEGSVLDAVVILSGERGEMRVKVRACEAIVMAIKYSLPIRVAEEVLKRASILDVDAEDGIRENDAGRFVRLLEELDPKDMGKYPM